MKTVDARGLLCPKPLIATKKVFKDLALGDQMQILLDNDTARQNVERFLGDNGAQLETAVDKGEIRILVTRREPEMAHPDETAYCAPPPPPRHHVICITSDLMGTGDEELGGILMKAFVNTIEEAEPIPAAILLYNRGIFLTLKGAATVGALEELQKQGVNILVCGTCLNYYEQKENLAVGTISNMYDILQTLTSAGHVIYP